MKRERKRVYDGLRGGGGFGGVQSIYGGDPMGDRGACLSEGFAGSGAFRELSRRVFGTKGSIGAVPA